MSASARQQHNQRRVEGLIGLAAPVLDFVLVAGDRASRLLIRGEDDYYPIRSADESTSLRSGAAAGSEPGLPSGP